MLPNIIDSVGFGSSHFDFNNASASYVLSRLMRGVLNKFNKELDCVVYVIKKSRLTNATYPVHKHISKDSTDKDEQRNNPFIQRISIESVSFMTYEFECQCLR